MEIIYNSDNDYESLLFQNLEKDNILLLCVLSKGNPGATTVLINLLKEIQDIDILRDILKKIWKLNIVGSRLWYIYKNECNQNINKLINIDLKQFTDDYFYEKFEKYS